MLNNKLVQYAYNVELEILPTLPIHSISTAPLKETYIRFGKTSNPKIVEVMKEIHDMKNMGNQKTQGYIEDLFHSIIWLQHHSILRKLLGPSFQGNLVSHTLAFINVYFSSLGMYILEALFRKWFHWKYSYK